MEATMELQVSQVDSQVLAVGLDARDPEIEQRQQTFEAYPEGGFRAYSVCKSLFKKFLRSIVYDSASFSSAIT